ncbi:biofilm regulation protein kinase SiaB [Halomonas sp. DP5Y7-2]|uniref:biofilm regulation protein kinase SiaB n=1 Tax=Halomonas sp. DP5Y7-2 TaxID=2859076 RepID=UPI001C98E7D3|nr:biofilm regulation protein kinase SiaB [Halomonas sp. DP5Y7-2]MBY5984933.1 biofilm regulation protein kinase SiaB [Halomonas sp. DP5Y7-2]
MDLLTLREQFDQQRVLLSFNGPISHSLIEEIGKAIRNYLNSESAEPSAAMDVFSTYIEMTQNISHYATAMGYDDHRATATVAVARSPEGHYQVSAGNVVEHADGERLMATVGELSGLDASELKRVYKQQLRKPREEGSRGAGLGLIDMARKSCQPLKSTLKPMSDQQSFFCITATI